MKSLFNVSPLCVRERYCVTGSTVTTVQNVPLCHYPTLMASRQRRENKSMTHCIIYFFLSFSCLISTGAIIGLFLTLEIITLLNSKKASPLLLALGIVGYIVSIPAAWDWTAKVSAFGCYPELYAPDPYGPSCRW